MLPVSAHFLLKRRAAEHVVVGADVPAFLG